MRVRAVQRADAGQRRGRDRDGAPLLAEAHHARLEPHGYDVMVPLEVLRCAIQCRVPDLWACGTEERWRRWRTLPPTPGGGGGLAGCGQGASNPLAEKLREVEEKLRELAEELQKDAQQLQKVAENLRESAGKFAESCRKFYCLSARQLEESMARAIWA